MLRGLQNYIICIDFETSVFKHPRDRQADIYTKILVNAFETFVPKRTIQIRPNDPPWCSKYTRLLMRKNNRNYKFFKRAKNKYENAKKLNNITDDILTKLKNKKDKTDKNKKKVRKGIFKCS